MAAGDASIHIHHIHIHIHIYPSMSFARALDCNRVLQSGASFRLPYIWLWREQTLKPRGEEAARLTSEGAFGALSLCGGAWPACTSCRGVLRSLQHFTELECITPGHGVGTVSAEVALTHSRVPSSGSVTFEV